MSDRFTNPQEPPNGYVSLTKPRSDRFGETFAPAPRERANRYPRADWARLAEASRWIALLARKIYDQGREGSCATQATVQAWMLAMTVVNPRWAIPLSAMPLYKALSRGPNSGTTINENLAFMRATGTLPLDTPGNRQWLQDHGLNPEHVMPETGYHTPLPRGWEDTAQHFRVLDASDCRDFADIASGVLDKKPCVYGSDGHAKSGYGISQRASGLWQLDYLNSWGRWGDPIGPPPAKQYGVGHETESNLAPQIPGYGAWIVESVVVTDVFTDYGRD